MKEINFVKRWETRHSLYKLEGALRAHIKYQNIFGCDCHNILMIIRSGVVTTYYDQADLEKAPIHGYHIINNRGKIEKYLNEAADNCDKLLNLSRKIHSSRLSDYNNRQLAEIYDRYFEYFSKLFGYYNLSRPDYLKNVETKIKKNLIKREKDLNIQSHIFSTLTLPTADNLLNKYDIDQLNFSLAIKKIMKDRKIQIQNLERFISSNKTLTQKLRQIVKKYCWLTTHEENPPLDKHYFLKKIKKLLKLSDQKISRELQRLKLKNVARLEAKKKLIKKYKFEKGLVNLCNSVADLAELRWKIRFWWTESSYYSRKMFAEIDKRIGYNAPISEGLWHSDYLLTKEVLLFLNQEKSFRLDAPLERFKHSMLLMHNKRIDLLVGNKANIMEKKFVKQQNIKNIKEILGVVANKGIARGMVWIISPSDRNQLVKADKMRNNDILVAAMTRPQLMEAMSKAAAIVTDEGGITCHAAVVSRELGIPCIVGTHVATKVLKDGDLIEVDANQGLVKLLRRR